MAWQAWFTLGMILLALYAMVRGTYAPANVMLGAVVVLLVAGVIDPAEAFSGFGNSAPITVAALYVLARAVDKTGVMHPVLRAVVGRDGSAGPSTTARLCATAAGASAFLNNTPLVAMLIGPVSDWAERSGVSPSRFLMPVSYAVILGGVVTLIGTSTNLVVSGLLDARTGRPMSLFEITPVGLPVAIVGITVMVLLAPRLLPERRPVRRDVAEGGRDFTVAMRVVPGGPIDGTTVERAGLRNLQGVFLAEVNRASGEVVAPAASSTELRGNDWLCFVGRVDHVLDVQSVPGLISTEEEQLTGVDSARHTFFEAVIGAASPLVGTTLKAIRFRSAYQAAVLAIHRAGHRVHAKLGEVELRVGDTLLVLTDPGFRARYRDRPDFLLVSALDGTPPAVTRKAWLVATIMALVVLVAGLGVVPMLQAALLGAIAVVVFGVLTGAEARSAIDLDVVLVVAASFGVGAAMQESGLADVLAAGIIGIFDGFGPLGVFFGILVATSIVTEVVTNTAAAAIVFPIAYSTALKMGEDPRVFAVAVATMASTSFLTPIGYQTNTMVYGPGGYQFGDYARLGAPITLAVLGVILLVARFWYGIT